MDHIWLTIQFNCRPVYGPHYRYQMLSTKGQRLVLWCGPNQLYSVVIRDRFFMGKKEMDWPSLTFGRIVFDWLFESRDVTERAEKQHDFLLFVPNGSDLHEEPHRCSCSRGTRPHIQYSAATSAQPHINIHCVHDDTEICSLEKEKKKKIPGVSAVQLAGLCSGLPLNSPLYF